MAPTKSEMRQKLALDMIRQVFSTESGKMNINLFIEHHIAEVPPAYWEQHLGTATPGPKAVIGLLEFQSSWGEEDLEYFDFTLPGEITNYVVSVHFNSAGEVDEISLES
jgi:hypothetical protein